jgi:hypothetical protein
VCYKRGKGRIGAYCLQKDIIGTYTYPNTVVEYFDGEIRQEFTIVYMGEILSGDIQLDEGSTEYKPIIIKFLII